MNGNCPTCQHPLPAHPVTAKKEASFEDQLGFVLPIVGICGLILWWGVDVIEVEWSNWWWAIVPLLGAGTYAVYSILRRLSKPRLDGTSRPVITGYPSPLRSRTVHRSPLASRNHHSTTAPSTRIEDD